MHLFPDAASTQLECKLQRGRPAVSSAHKLQLLKMFHTERDIIRKIDRERERDIGREREIGRGREREREREREKDRERKMGRVRETPGSSRCSLKHVLYR